MARTIRYYETSGRVISGDCYCWRTHEAALRAARRASTNPTVVELSDYSGRPIFVAGGDHYITSDGHRGQYVYGRKGLVEIDAIGAPMEELIGRNVAAARA